MTVIGTSGLATFPLCLGGNVFGWTADEETSYEILDAFVAAGGNAIDVADSYPYWAPGCSGGESEEILGRWMRARGNREAVVVGTKVGRFPGNHGLTRRHILDGIEGSLRRLQTDYVDLYYCHSDDETTPLDETLTTLGELVDDGRVRAIAASNYSAERLAEALETSDALGVARFCAVQPHYSLVERSTYEGPLEDLCEREGLACLPYWPLAAGYLTGKYADPGTAGSARSDTVTRFQTPRNERILDAVRSVAHRHGVEPAAIALAWLLTRPTVVAPIASVSRPAQLPGLLASVTVSLTAEDLALLDRVSAREE